MASIASGVPILLDDIKANPVSLERISANQWTTSVIGAGKNDSIASERDLQNLVIHCPNLLPFQHFSSVFHPSVCIGREVSTDVGPIDCLFLSNQGRLTIVETKLFKNPEGRRAVVAQLLDYCDRVSRFSFDQLDASARKFAQTYHPQYKYSGLYDFVRWSLKRHVKVLEEAGIEDSEWVVEERQFRSQTEKAIRRGEMLGLIVGDHIDKRLISLVDFAHAKPGLALELGIVELAFHRPAGKLEPLVVIPTVIEWAVPIARTVVDVRVDATGAVNVNVAEANEAVAVATGKRAPQLSSNLDFLDKVQASIPAAVDATKRLLEKMQELADVSNGSIESNYQSATANLYWIADDGRARRFFSLNGNTGRVRIWTEYLRKGGYEQFVKQIEDIAEPHVPGIRNQNSSAINILEIDVETLCDLVESLADIFSTAQSSNS